MPKHKRKEQKDKGKSTSSPGSKDYSGDENEMDENASTVSNVSTTMSFQDLGSIEEGGKSKSTEEIFEKVDDIEAQINSCLDNLLEKGYKERENSLKTLKKFLSNKYLIEYLISKRFTLSESLIRCLKKGKPAEQLLAGDVLMLLFIQFGHLSDTIELLNESKPVLTELIDDEKVDARVRANCARALGLAVFVADDSSIDIKSILQKYESIFSNSFAKGDKTLRTFAPDVYELHGAALSSWCLLLLLVPTAYANQLCQKYLKNFGDLLKSPDVDLRIVAGETIAFLYDLIQCESHVDLSEFEDEELVDILTALANDSSKHRSKKERKYQRHSFRDILKTIEGNEYETETVKFASESLYIDNWIRRKEYATFCDLLGNGMNIHLKENEFIRDLFDLGAPLNDDVIKQKLNSMSRLEKAQYNKEKFKLRTKSLNKRRENKDNASAELVD